MGLHPGQRSLWVNSSLMQCHVVLDHHPFQHDMGQGQSCVKLCWKGLLGVHVTCGLI